MACHDGEKTDPALIDRVGDRADSSAWRRFDATYRPMVVGWGPRLGAGGGEAEELGQVVMVELLDRMPEFRYDPKRSFRKWLYCLARCRAIDRARRRCGAERPLPEGDIEAGPTRPGAGRAEGEDTPPGPDPRLALAVEVGRAVRARVGPESWRAYWLIRVEGRPIPEVAAELGKTYAAAYRNQARIARMIEQEVHRRLGAGPGEGAAP